MGLAAGLSGQKNTGSRPLTNANPLLALIYPLIQKPDRVTLGLMGGMTLGAIIAIVVQHWPALALGYVIIGGVLIAALLFGFKLGGRGGQLGFGFSQVRFRLGQLFEGRLQDHIGFREALCGLIPLCFVMVPSGSDLFNLGTKHKLADADDAQAGKNGQYQTNSQ